MKLRIQKTHKSLAQLVWEDYVIRNPQRTGLRELDDKRLFIDGFMTGRKSLLGQALMYFAMASVLALTCILVLILR